ncbi:MAG: hypothetical protein M1830_006002, partial [Pleopsidium flavum]
VQRLWTLQEALLSNQLFCKVSGGLLDYREFFVSDVIALAAESIVARKPLGWLGSPMMMPLSRQTGDDEDAVLMNKPSVDLVAGHLSKRTSSRKADEVLAIASFIGLDASYNGGRVPVDIIFLDGKKVTLPGFVWAPAVHKTPDGAGDEELVGWVASEEVDEDLFVLFDGHLDPEIEAGVIPSYDVLVIPRSLREADFLPLAGR